MVDFGVIEMDLFWFADIIFSYIFPVLILPQMDQQIKSHEQVHDKTRVSIGGVKILRGCFTSE